VLPPSSIPQGYLGRAVPQPFLTENLLLKTPYKFKKSYCGTPEPQTVQDAPWLHGPSLKNIVLWNCVQVLFYCLFVDKFID
jgi:hypothetical protein